MFTAATIVCVALADGYLAQKLIVCDALANGIELTPKVA